MSKKHKIVTPAGTALWPRLSSPDTKFSERGKYSTGLVLSAEDSEELRETLDEIAEAGWQEAIESAPNVKAANGLKKYNYHPPYKPEEDANGEETGNYIFSFWTYATDKNGAKKKAPTVVDAKRRPMGEIVGAGSTIKVSSGPNPYQMPSSKTYGVTLYLNAVQVLDLVAPSGGGAGDFDEEDGFESEEEPNSPVGAGAGGGDGEDF